MKIKKNIMLVAIWFVIGCDNSIIDMENNLTVVNNSEPYYQQQWYADIDQVFYDENNIDYNASIHAGEFIKKYTGKDIKIAVIDDGLDVTHEDLNNSIIQTYDILTKSQNVAHTYQSDYHGTAITGIIAARKNNKGIQGIASESQIIFLKYKPTMRDSETIELFKKAEEFGADIINCSWGTNDVSESVKEVIQDIAKNGRDGKGIIVVFAAGNNNQDMGNDESSIPEVISVGSSSENNSRAWYSNFGKNLDLIAPGGEDIGITTLDVMGENGIAILDENYILYDDNFAFKGTSASAPIVSGIIALLLEKNESLTRKEIEELLHKQSDKIGDIPYNLGRNDYYGYGKINISKLFEE